VNGETYFGAGGRLYALDSDGTVRWSYVTGTSRSVPAIWSGDGSIAATGDALYLINSDGSIRWSYEGAGGNHSPSFGDSGRIYTGSGENDGNVHAFDSDGALVWSYMTIAGAYCDTVTADELTGRVYAGSILPQPSNTPCPQRLYALNANGTLVWSYRPGDAGCSILLGTIALAADGKIYHGSADNRIYALSPGGGLLWTYGTGAEIQGGPAISSDVLYISDAAGVFYAIGSVPRPTPVPSCTFTLYGGPGKENWVSVPFEGTGISTLQDLAKSITAAYSPEAWDKVTVEYWDAAENQLYTVEGTYDIVEWIWRGESVPISTGAMCKVKMTRNRGGQFEFTWAISGINPSPGTVEFTLYGGDSPYLTVDNWISLPYDKGELTTTIDVAESIGAKIADPEYDDRVTVVLWDAVNQTQLETTGTYQGNGYWEWNEPEGGYVVSAGTPFIARLFRDGVMPTITWP